jgi:two-component system, OmpR family, sensor histidine kinase KdpD
VELLERTERMARDLHDLDRMKSELIQVLSHELLTPVTVIQGATQTLSALGDRMSRESVETLATSVARATTRLRRVIGNVTATARLDRDDAEVHAAPISARELVAAGTGEFEGGRLVLSPEGSDARLWADPSLAPRALVALLENALDLSPSNVPVEINVEPRGTVVEVRVADRGPGIPDHLRERIFQAFSQGDTSITRSHEGLGIGLYLARKIMAAHRGRISFADRPGGGSVFTLSFPAAPVEPS